MILLVLGPLELSVDGAREPVTSPRLRRLLAALSIDPGHVVHSDRLADAVWGDQPPDNVDASLHNLISRLRRQLAEVGLPDLVVTRPPGYVLDLARTDLDAGCFEALVDQARHLVEADPAQAARILNEAMSLWRGSAYAEFADEPFVLARVTELIETRTAAAELQVDSELRMGNTSRAITLAERLCDEHPFRESPHAQLMIGLYRVGRQADALALYDSFRRRLADDLGLDPTPGLQEVQARILASDPALQDVAPSSVPSRPVPTRTTGNLRRPAPRELIGRREAIAAVQSAVAGSVTVTLTGPGGVGKTTLAVHVADELTTTFDDGVWWCELAALSPGDPIADAIATTLGLQARHDVDPVARLVDALGNRRVLVILDNCEHLVDQAAEVVDAINQRCPEVAVLATSREPLGVAAERTVAIEPLDEAAALELLVARATEAIPGFELDDDNAPALAEITRRLDGLPLALELAAIRMRAISPDDLAARLTWRFRLLRQGVRTAPGRHQTLEAVVRWSYELLDETDRIVLELVSAFSGSFTLESAEELVALATRGVREWEPGEVAGVVLSLADRSMVVAMPGDDRRGTRWRLLETIRAYGRGRLGDRPYADAVPDVHADLFATMLVATHEALFTAAHAQAAAVIEAEFDDLRAAVSWATDHHPDAAADVIGGLLPFCEHRMPIEPLGWAERLIARIDDDGLAPPRHLARVLTVAASCARFAGELDYAEALIDRGLRMVDPDDITEAHLRYLQAEVALFRGRIEDGSRFHELFTASAHRSGQPSLMLLAELMDVLKVAYEGDLDAAVRRADELATHAAAMGASDTIAAWTAYTRGEVLIDREPARAQELLQDALARSRRVGDRYLTGVTLVSVASLTARHGDPRAAAIQYVDVIEHWFSSGDWTHQWTTMRNIVDLFARLDAYPAAAVLLGALDTRATTSAGFGAELERTDSVRRAVATQLDAREVLELSRQGALMSDDEIVGYVLAELRSSGTQASR